MELIQSQARGSCLNLNLNLRRYFYRTLYIDKDILHVRHFHRVHTFGGMEISIIDDIEWQTKPRIRDVRCKTPALKYLRGSGTGNMYTYM